LLLFAIKDKYQLVTDEIVQIPSISRIGDLFNEVSDFLVILVGDGWYHNIKH
jgi:hypothetical protein